MYRNSILFIVTVVVILTLVLFPTSWFDHMIADDIDGFREKIGTVLELTHQEDARLAEACQTLQNDWEKHMGHWSFFIHHSVIEKIDLSICTLIETAKDGNLKGAELEARRLDRLFDATEHQDDLSASNIF